MTLTEKGAQGRCQGRGQDLISCGMGGGTDHVALCRPRNHEKQVLETKAGPRETGNTYSFRTAGPRNEAQVKLSPGPLMSLVPLPAELWAVGSW